MRLLPGVLKELLKHVPTVLFQVVDWNQLANELPKLSKRMLQKEGYRPLLQKQQELIHPFGITLSSVPVEPSSKISKKQAEEILKLYFAQLFSANGLFLDLRSQHFSLVGTDLVWNPSGLWTKLDEDFRQGLLNVYEGFYLQKEDVYFEGLKKIGLIADTFSEDDKQKLGDLFKAQFGSALTSEMSFDLEHFKNSILKTSNFMLTKKVKISNDFLYLGIYLVTLYSHLEQCSEKLPVRDIYLSVRNQLAQETSSPL